MKQRPHPPYSAWRPRRKPQHGFMLLESLVALLLFSLGALALVGLQTSMLRAQTGAKYRGDATFLAADLVGIMWTDTPNLARYSDCATHARCQAWLDKVGEILPSGSSTITAGANSQWEITVSWQLPGEEAHRFSTSATISPNAVTP